MEMIKKMHYWNIYLFLISITLFSLGMWTGNMDKVILYMLEFTVIFELVRAFNHYIKDGRFKVRYGIDAAIFFTIKELYIAFTIFKIDHDYVLMLLSIFILFLLIILRLLNFKYSDEFTN